jgi:rubrerythrin
MQKAIEMEQDSQEFYRNSAEDASNPLAKQTFEALAEWEVEHEKLLRDVHDKAEATDSCPALTELDAEQMDMMEQAKEIFKGALDAVEGGVEHDPSLDDAYSIAMEKERKAVAFYKGQLDKTDDEAEQHLYEFLLGQERGHLELLATTEEYLNDTKYWHFKEEMWMATG